MNSRAFTLSLVIAGLAMFMVYSYIEGREEDFKADFGDQRQVVIAKADIKELETIDDRKIEISTVPGKYLMPGAFTNIEDLYNTIASTPIKKGEQITAPRVVYPGAKTGLSRQISKGKRAFAIEVSDNQAVGKLLKPGDRVDVLSMIDYAGGKKEKLKVITVLQDVYVLATGKRVTREIPVAGLKVDREIQKLDLNIHTNFNTVTLELSPFDVQKMVFLNQAGNGIYLSLRNNNDKEVKEVGDVKLFDILGTQAAGEAKAYFLEQAERREKRR